MLTESFILSTLNPKKPSSTTATGIHIHEFQPIPALKTTFKKNFTNPNCLAVHPTHIFAAQADNAVVYVYNLERNNQEATVPFPERIHSIALAGEADGAGILILGTEGGRIILWELATGRQVSTPQHHLQPTKCLAVDPTSNFLLSGSPDSTIHVWSIPGLLSFSASAASEHGRDLPYSPLRSLANHRAAITAIVMGHSFSRNNIAVSAASDNTCIVWDYARGDLLHTFLLPASPLCLAIDPADRAVYAGYEDGSIQLIDFYTDGGLTQQLHDPVAKSTPTQPPPTARWPAITQPGFAVFCLQVNYDGTCLLSGHEDGKIHSWDVAASRYGKQIADFSAPVTNLHMLKPSGFPKPETPIMKLHNVVKPRYESFANGDYGNAGAVPSNYTFTAQFTSNIPLLGSTSDDFFHEALTHPSFPPTFLDEVISDFTAWHSQGKAGSDSSDLIELRTQNTALTSQLEDAVARQQSALAEIQDRDKADWRRQKDEEVKAARKKKRRLRRMKVAEMARKKEMGEAVDDEDELMGNDREDEDDLSSSTDELSDSP